MNDDTPAKGMFEVVVLAAASAVGLGIALAAVAARKARDLFR